MATKNSATEESAGAQAIIHGQPDIWHKSAPSEVRGSWEGWKAYLTKKGGPAPVAKLVPGRSNPHAWSVAKDVAPATDMSEKAILGWLDDSAGCRGACPGNGCQAPLDYALQAVCLADHIRQLAETLSEDTWWALLSHLIETADEAAAIDLESAPLVNQLLGGELPLTLAHHLPELKPCRKLAAAAKKNLSRGLDELLDGEGVISADHLPQLRPLLACWTRCKALGKELKDGCWNKDAETNYEWLVRTALRTTRPDGTHVFSGDSAGKWCADLFAAALELGGDEDDEDIADRVLPGRKGPDENFALPTSAVHSEWAATAVMQPYWDRNESRLTVLYPHDSIQVELSCSGKVLISGTWELDVQVDGRPAAVDGKWQEVCWFSDDDVDYLELEIDLEHGLKVQRQMLLARDDDFLLLADAVHGLRSAKIAYRSALPLFEGASFEPAEESFDGALSAGKKCATVMPLALPEWRTERATGELQQADGALQLRQSIAGRRLYAPLFFDLDRKRLSKKFTWRRLTVAEKLEIVPADVAAGFRVAVGKEQWLIYRSLSEPANRTLLGHNLSDETLVAQFDTTGEVEAMLEI